MPFTALSVNATLLKSGDEFFNKMAELIKSAQTEIHIQTYIFEPDETGNYILQLLKESAMRGVKIFLLLDAFGCINFSDVLMNDLKQSGIEVRKFSLPVPFIRLYTGKRLHHKVLLVDSNQAIIGGINIANRYSGFDGAPAWLDYAIYFTGNPCIKVQQICARLFFKAPSSPLVALRKLSIFKRNRPENEPVEVVLNDWYKQRFEISRSYRQALRDSKSEITILASYFLPGIRIKKLLKRASQRGVKIALVLPCSPDVVLFKKATVYLYNWLIRNQISIYEYQPGMLHAKCGVFDNRLVMVGSFNLISLSEYGSVEMNVNVLNEDFALAASTEFSKVIKMDCKQINLQDLEKSNSLKQLSNWISFQLLRIVMYVYLALSTDTES